MSDRAQRDSRMLRALGKDPRLTVLQPGEGGLGDEDYAQDAVEAEIHAKITNPVERDYLIAKHRLTQQRAAELRVARLSGD